MLNFLLLGATLLTAAPVVEGHPAPTPADLTAYREAQANAGRDPDAHVRLALWCEAHGLHAERMKHLAIAVVSNPRHSMARGLLGVVQYRGRWQHPDAINENAKNDTLLAEYRDRRAKTATDDADAQWSLGLWCQEHGLKDEAAAHFTAVIKLDPKREAPWKQLGFKKQGGRWVTEAQVAEEKAEAGRQKEADRYWKPLLEKYRDGLSSKSEKRRNEAETALSQITDPRAVPMIWAQFANGSVKRQARAVQVLGQIDAESASSALAWLAVFSNAPEIRRTAIETLKRRDVREYAGLLIDSLRDAIEYDVRPVGGPGSPGALLVKGSRKDFERRYVPPPMPWMRIPFTSGWGDLLTTDENGLPMIMRGALFRRAPVPGMNSPSLPFRPIPTPTGPTQIPPDLIRQMIDHPAQAAATLPALAESQAFQREQANARARQALMLEAQQRRRPNLDSFRNIKIGQAVLETENAAASLQQQLETDVAALERSNSAIREANRPFVDVLDETTGADLGSEPSAWRTWWLDQLGYAQKRPYNQQKPTVVEVVTRPLPPVSGFDDNSNGYVRRMSCFGAGTLVHTLAGVQPIEALQEGDRVLSQDTTTGSLNYKSILVVHRNPPSPTYRIELGSETLISSHFHRFWKAGSGWVMARDLKAGDTVRTLRGLIRIGEITSDEVQPVFNLDVADNANFFVGRDGALVHDNTLPELRQAPFDAPDVVETAAARP